MNATDQKAVSWGLAALVAATCAVIGASQATSSAASNITLTEEDYFNTPGQIAALAAYSKQFEAAHPGVTVKRQYVPFANLNTKLLTQAAGHALPNLLAVDNPFVSTMISTGQVVALSGLKGFSTKGYFPAVINEGLSNGKYYSLAGGRRQLDRVDVQHRDAEGGRRQPSQDVGAAGDRRQGSDDFGPLRDCVDL